MTRRAPLGPDARTPRFAPRVAALALALGVGACCTLLGACAPREEANPVDTSTTTTVRAAAQDEQGAPGATAGASSDSSLIGKLVDDVAPDSAYLSAWGVYPLERHIGIVLVRVGVQHYLLADTLVGYDGPRARWLIRQAQRVEGAAKGEAWVASCAIGKADASDGTVVARVTLGDGDTLAPVHSAWRLDPSTWQFRRFPVDSLTCYSEGMGA